MKTKIINGILCSPLTLIPYSDGWLAVDEKSSIQENDWVHDDISDSVYQAHENSLHNRKVAPELIRKVIGASASLNLPVLRLPEREDVEKIIADLYFAETGMSIRSSISPRLHDEIKAFGKLCYRACAATHGYTEQQVEKAVRAGIIIGKHFPDIQTQEVEIKKYLNLASLRPQMVWVQVEEVPNSSWGFSEDEPEILGHKFKSRDGELIVVEYE